MTQIIEYAKIQENYLIHYFNFERIIENITDGHCCLSLNKFMSFNDWRNIYNNLEEIIHLYLQTPQTQLKSETIFMKNSNLQLHIVWEKTDPFLIFLAGLSNKHDNIYPYMITVQVNIASNIDEYVTARESSTADDSNIRSNDVITVSESNESANNVEMIKQPILDESSSLPETFAMPSEHPTEMLHESSDHTPPDHRNVKVNAEEKVASKKRKSDVLKESLLLESSQKLPSKRIIVTRAKSNVKSTPKVLRSKSSVKSVKKPRAVNKKKKTIEKKDISSVSNSSTCSSLFNVSSFQRKNGKPKRTGKSRVQGTSTQFKQQRIDLSSLTSDHILKSFEENAADLKAIFSNFLEQENHCVKRSTEYDHIKVMSFLTGDHIDQMLELFYTHFVNTNLDGSLTFTNLFFEVMVPEWIVLIIMKKYRLVREAAIARINMQQADDIES